MDETKVLKTLVLIPAEVNFISLVWDEFSEIERSKRPSHVISVWNKVLEAEEVLNNNEEEVTRWETTLSRILRQKEFFELALRQKTSI